MVKYHANYELLDLTGATGTGTALSYKNTEKCTAQVDIVNGSTGVTTVVISGTTAATSTGTFVTLDTQSKTATTSYAVEINGAYNFIKAACSAIATTGSTVGVNVITQGSGC